MKTPEEIKKLAEKYVLNLRISSSSLDTVRDRNRTFGYLSGYEQCQQDNADKKYTIEDMENFAFFHRSRMSGGQQSDNEFYVQQSLELFLKQLKK